MIFVDTGAFVARHLQGDQHHEVAQRGWSRIQSERSPCCTSTLVLSETLTLLARMADGAFAAETGRRLYASASLRILRPEATEEKQALELLVKFADQSVSYCDAVSFALMRKHRIERVFGFDGHFERAGFRLWP